MVYLISLGKNLTRIEYRPFILLIFVRKGQVWRRSTHTHTLKNWIITNSDAILVFYANILKLIWRIIIIWVWMRIIIGLSLRARPYTSIHPAHIIQFEPPFYFLVDTNIPVTLLSSYYHASTFSCQKQLTTLRNCQISYCFSYFLRIKNCTWKICYNYTIFCS